MYLKIILSILSIAHNQTLSGNNLDEYFFLHHQNASLMKISENSFYTQVTILIWMRYSVITTAVNEIIFIIYNETFINPDIQRRIFQQYFSTKTGTGRGFGTFGTKLICEKFLHGAVDFSSSATTGTQFYVRIPLLHS